MTRLPSPPVADTRPAAKPIPEVDILTDAKAEARYNAAIEAWGDGEAARVRRICKWFVANGVALNC